MKMHRFFISDNLISGGDLFLRDPGIVRQIKTVLRIREGDVITLFNERGQEARARITGLFTGHIGCRLEEVAQRAADAPIVAVVYCAILKRENFEWVAQKITEIGASALVPCLTARTVKQRIVPERITAIMREAAEQSGRATIPLLRAPVSFADALDAALAQSAACILFDPRGAAIGKSDYHINSGATISLFIGPEGGWSDEECARAQQRGVEIVSLGGTVLRAETAAVVGTYAAVWEWGKGRDKIN